MQIVVMPTVPEYDVYKEASPEVQENMTFYYNSSSSLQTWSANSEAGSRALAPIFGSIFGEGQGNKLLLIKSFYLNVLILQSKCTLS